MLRLSKRPFYKRLAAKWTRPQILRAGTSTSDASCACTCARAALARRSYFLLLISCSEERRTSARCFLLTPSSAPLFDGDSVVNPAVACLPTRNVGKVALLSSGYCEATFLLGTATSFLRVSDHPYFLLLNFVLLSRRTTIRYVACFWGLWLRSTR